MTERESSERMSLFGHIEELRTRFVRALFVFMAGFVIAYFLCREEVATFLRTPLFEIMPPDQQRLYFTGMFEGFFVHLKLSAVTAIFGLAPYFFWEFWGFVSPGLHANEKKYVVPFLISATGFFFAGAGFAYKVLFPIAFKYFISYTDGAEVPWLTMDAYYTTVLKLLLLFGLSFEFPVLLFFLGVFGLVTPVQLRSQRRMAFVVIAVFSALFAPPDAISMVLMMAPLYLMYEGMITVLDLFLKMRARKSKSN